MFQEFKRLRMFQISHYKLYLSISILVVPRGPSPRHSSCHRTVRTWIITGMLPAAQLGGGCWGRAPPPLFHFSKGHASKLKELTHFTHVLLSHPSYYKYTCAPLSKLPSCAPACFLTFISVYFFYH